LAEQRSPKPQVGGSTPSSRAEKIGTSSGNSRGEQKSMKEKIVNFFIDIRKEMEKVTWPSKEELTESTKIVIIITLAIAAFAWVVDFAVSGMLNAIL
jgi:preprotein translocase subunit SecE